MSQTKQSASQTKVEVPLTDGTVWEGTMARLRQEHPDWVQYAEVPQLRTKAPQSTRQSHRSDVLDADENADFANDPPNSGRLPSSSVKYAPIPGQVRFEYRPGTVIKRRSSAPTQTGYGARETEDLPQGQAKRRGWFRSHPVLWLGLGMLAMLALWQAGITVGNWWMEKQNDWTYTQVFRTFSLDQAVGHNGDSQAHPSHFIVQNEHRRIIIIEFPNNDVSKALIYNGPVLLGDGQDKTPVTISFQVNPQTHRIDLVLHVESQRYVFTNNGTKFLEPSV